MRIGKRDEVGRLERMLVDRLVGDLADETERSFRADDQMHQHVDRIVEIEQGVERIADRVLDLVFAPDQRHELRIGLDLVMKIMQGRQKLRPLLPKIVARLRVAGIEDGAVSQHYLETAHCVVGVVGDAAAHARRIVVDHPADLAGRLARRIRSELLVVGFQRLVGIGDDDRRPERDPLAIILDRNFPEAVAEHAENALGDRLAGQ